ncbi:hypothetical protein AMR41_13950 [Hapalosiphon sp. MRB220]|nr:hypothetical protein AMR41_13950 [Hapalosiphon sp. MRB220]
MLLCLCAFYLIYEYTSLICNYATSIKIFDFVITQVVVVITQGAVVITQGAVVITQVVVVITQVVVVITLSCVVITQVAVVITQVVVVITLSCVVITLSCVVITQVIVVRKHLNFLSSKDDFIKSISLLKADFSYETAISIAGGFFEHLRYL